MQLLDDTLIRTASDLTDFLACGHLARLELARVQAGERRAARDEATELIAAKGLTHEARFFQRLRDEGRSIVDLRARATATPHDEAEATLAAMASGAQIIYQATFFDDGWLGRADFLQRVDTPSAHRPWSYEVIDTKLSLEPRPAAVMQLCMYSELLERAQGISPASLHIVLGDGTLASYRHARFTAYFRTLRRAFLEHLDGDAATYPTPVKHCAQCDWSLACEDRRTSDDHLSLVAWMRHAQAERLAAAGIVTMSALAQAPDDARPSGMAGETFERLRHQAQLQRRALDDGARTGEAIYHYDLLVPEAGLGFARLPPPSAGDVYFDMEGDPLYEADRGLEYLFGNYLPEGAYARFWALTPEEEQTAFEACVDLFLARRATDPAMHVYHYAPYEKTALRRLSVEFNSRVDEVDQLLRDNVFVDLYEIVRQGIMISQPSYSIKKLEPFYGFTRRTDVKRGDDSIVSFERWRANPNDRAVLADIEAYNDDDCRSTYELRRWLDARKREAEAAFDVEIAWPPPGKIDGAVVESPPVENALRAARWAVVQRLQAMPNRAVAHRLFADLVGYHVREEKPLWWEYYDRCDNADTLTEEDGKALGGLALDPTRPPIAPTGRGTLFTYAYTFPPQRFDGDVGEIHEAYLRKKAGTLEAIEQSADGGVALVKIATNIEPASIRAIFPHKVVGTEKQQAALIALGENLAADPDPDPAPSLVIDLLTRAAPRLRGYAAGALIQPKTVDGHAIADIIGRLQDSYLVVQGPPGTGKTTTGARAIVQLLAQGLRIGITSRGHAAIDHLLAAVDRVAIEAGVAYRGARKAKDEKSTPLYIRNSPNLSQQKGAKLFAADVRLVAGTPWTFVGPDIPPSFFDVLIVDEAGQFALADALAIQAVAKNLVLLGDPLQLKQVAQGVHPRYSDASVLEHLLGADTTIPPDRGIFLHVSYRMHPSICGFISEQIYDGRLAADPANACQAIESNGLCGAGLRYAPIAHVGNGREAKEEADWIVARIAELLAGEVIARNGVARPLEVVDILIVTPYNAQRLRIERTLQAAGIVGIAVGTVDKFQGQEAPVVFYSMATSSGDDLPRDIAFLYERNRFNVAISRAKALCVLVASPALLRPQCKTIEEIEMVNLLCAYVEAATVIA